MEGQNNEGVVEYVGMSRNLRQRLKTHPEIKTGYLVSFLMLEDESELAAAEVYYTELAKPRYYEREAVFLDDLSYFSRHLVRGPAG